MELEFRDSVQRNAPPNLNDYVERVHLILIKDGSYLAYLEAIYDEDAIEGSLAADNLEAARLIRNYARSKAIPQIANRKLATIVKALNIVLRKHGTSRKERSVTLGGKIVSTPNYD